MEALLTDLMNWINANPNWAGLVVLIVAALESLLVVGLFIPGTVVMFGIGALVAAGSMELLPTLVWAAVGAVIGDGSSFLIGRHFHQQLRVMWPFRNHPEMLNRSVAFFNQHGGKSVVLARFVGPVRPLLPAVAGMLDMSTRRFFIVNIASAVLWAPAYVLPGVLFGASLGVAAEIAGHLALLLAVLVALLWFSWWLMRRVARSLQPHAQAVQLGILDWSRGHRQIEPLVAALLDPEHPEARGMTILSGLLVITSWSFLLIAWHLTPGSFMDNLDLYLFHWMQALRTPLGDHLMLFVTGLGNAWVLYSFTLFSCLWLLWKRYWRAAIHWIITIVSVGLLTHAVKLYTMVERPPMISRDVLGYSFPSGHASLSVAAFGFLAVIFARELRGNWRWVPYSMAMLLVTAIGFSRLYLGAHWFSDVIGGWSLGAAWVALMGIAYRHHTAYPVSLRVFAPLTLAILVMVTGLYSHQYSQRDALAYQPLPTASIELTRENWLNGGWQALPAFRSGLEQKRHQVLNLQWLGSRKEIETRMLELGWKQPVVAAPASIMDLFNNDAGINKLPILPQLNNGRRQDILLTHPSGQPDRIMVFRLWKTRYRESGTQQLLWIGTLGYLKIKNHFGMLRYLKTWQVSTAALDEFIHELDAGNYHLAARTEQGENADSDMRTVLIWH